MNRYRKEIKWGIIFSFALLLWMLIEKILGYHNERIEEHAFFTSFFAIVAIGIYLLALYDKRKNYYNGRMTWKEGFLSGFYLTLVIVILSPLTQLIISKIITPEYFTNVIDYTVASGAMTLEEAQTNFSLKSYIFQSAVWALISGILTAAIAALLLRKKERGVQQTSSL